MINRRVAKVKSVSLISPGVWQASVTLDGEEAKALGYSELVGEAEPGCELILNTTAVDLGLGTGGFHFVMAVLPPSETKTEGPGHIMKLRYTPCQLRTLSVEEEDSPYHGEFTTWRTLGEMPVLVGTLHSMLAPIVTVLHRTWPSAKIAYIMTDGAALPIAFSRTVTELKSRGWLKATITCGHAYGGDYEAVNIYSALLAARYAVGADVAVVLMGPGVVGTGTVLGTTALEQASILDATAVLAGIPVAVPRISGADARERHQGISHHTLTVLGKLTHHSCCVPLPRGEKAEALGLAKQARAAGLEGHHQIRWFDTDDALDLLRHTDLHFSTMGRGLDDDPIFFRGATAAALAGAELIGQETGPIDRRKRNDEEA